MYSDPDLASRMARVFSNLTKGDIRNTTYVIARVTTSDGRSQIWMASAGRPMCGRCQKGAKRMGILRRVITAFKKEGFLWNH